MTPAPRALTRLERDWSLQALLDRHIAPPELCERAVRACMLVPTWPRWQRVRGPRSALAHAALAGKASGITLGQRVYVRRELFDAQGGLPLQLVLHEVAHVAQFLRDGTLRFLVRYVRDYGQGRLRGLDDRDAYLAIPYEVEARRVDRFVLEHAHDPELTALPRLYF